MTLALIILAAVALLEQVTFRFPSKARNAQAYFLIALLALGSTLAVVTYPNVATVVLAIASLYKVFNLARVLQGRMHEGYLESSTTRAAFWLTCLQLSSLICWVLVRSFYLSHIMLLTLFAGLVLVVILTIDRVMTLRIRRGIGSNPAALTSKDLPALSVLIPARNETSDLEACLNNLVASDYPKLEIIVLDDCSQTSKTSDIIRGFANRGVRFVPGGKLRKNWLAKNQAYETLAREASGELLLFCGVDARFAPQSLRLLVEELYARQALMLSIMPRNMLNFGHATVPQILRYGHELGKLRSSRLSPPVLSTCWLVHAAALNRFGGLKAVPHKIIPEEYFARQLAAQHAYSFILNNDKLNIATHKQPAEQIETAVRTLYPSLHQRPELVLAQAAIELICYVAPFILLVVAVVMHLWPLACIALISCIVALVTYHRLIKVMYGSSNFVDVVMQPWAMLTDVILLHKSMFLYEFSVVEWKGRNICLPVMHAYPHLPKI